MQSADCKVKSERLKRRFFSWLPHFALCSLHFALFTSSPIAAAAEPIKADILLKGGTIFDGTNSDSKVGDVAIKGDRIVGVGKFEVMSAEWEIDCTGLVICPGFIDLHNHSDSQIVSPKTRANVNFVMQGCTTIVTGNCGSGPVDCGEYLAKIDSAGAGTNVAHLLPQGSLRGKVLGSVQRKATADEVQQMRELADKAMRDGAFGMSTGLIYVPSSYADTAELIEIAKVVGKHGGIYASHIRGEGKDLLDSVAEAIKIGREGGCPIHVSHFKASGQDAWGLIRPAAQLIEESRKAGLKVTADQYPYIASSTSLDATILPTWSLAGGREKLLERLKNKEQTARIVKFVSERIEKSDDGERIRITSCEKHPKYVGRSIADIAKSEKSKPLDVALKITRDGGAGIVNFGMSEEDVRYAMTLPWVATASDGRAYLPSADKPHPRSYGTFPRKIGEYSVKENVLPLSAAIRSCTWLPADILGLTDRGRLAVDHFADVVVFDPKKIRDTATFDKPHQYATGLQYVFVNGEPAVKDGEATGSLAGRSLKRPDGK